MGFWSVPRFWLVFVASVALFITAAKSHGRQLRLERELAGHARVTFGATNHPFVEALWRKDRVRFWTLYPAFATVVAAYAFVAQRRGLPLPFPGAPDEARAWALAVLGLIWTPVVTFAGLGAVSLMRFRQAAEQPPIRAPGLVDPRDQPDWVAAALRGSAGWWALTLALAVATFVLATRPRRGG